MSFEIGEKVVTQKGTIAIATVQGVMTTEWYTEHVPAAKHEYFWDDKYPGWRYGKLYMIMFKRPVALLTWGEFQELYPEKSYDDYEKLPKSKICVCPEENLKRAE